MHDYTLNGLRTALAEIVAYFPVYRGYISARETVEEDLRNVYGDTLCAIPESFFCPVCQKIMRRNQTATAWKIARDENLIDKIKTAQVKAGESIVMDHLAKLGL